MTPAHAGAERNIRSVMGSNNFQMNKIFIELHVPNFDVAKDFYTKLGFEVVSDDGVIDGLGYFIMEREGAMINFYGGSTRVYEQSYFKRFPQDTIRGYEVEVTIPIDHLVSYYEEIKNQVPDNIVQLLSDKKDRSLRWKDFRIVDPFGFYLRFSEPIDWTVCHCGSGERWKGCHGK